MNWLLGREERPSALRLSGLDRAVLGLPLALCFALWMTSTQLLVSATRHDGGRTSECRYFTGTGVVQWQYGGGAGGAGRQGCPIIRKG